MGSSINGIESPTNVEGLRMFLIEQIDYFHDLIEDGNEDYIEFNEGALEGLSIALMAVKDVCAVMKAVKS